MLSNKIKKLRSEKGLSQEELAAELNVVRQTVSKWEKGLSLPDSDMILNLARVFDTTVSELLEENQSKENSFTQKTKSPKSKSLKITIIILLILGSPVWLSLAVAAASVIFSLYVSLWAVIVSLWAVAIAVAASSLWGLVIGFFHIFSGNSLSGVALIGAAFICAGLFIFFLLGCKATTKGILLLTKKFLIWIKIRFKKKEAA